MVLGDIVSNIPMAALVGVMIMVSIGTFDWQSLRNIRKMPLSDALVMVITVVIVVATRDLSEGVIAGVVISALVFGWRISRLKVTDRLEQGGTQKVYQVTGQLFFGTMSHFVDLFQPVGDPRFVVIDMSGSHVWDHSAVTALSKVLAKYREAAKEVTLVGLNDESRQLIERVGLELKGAH